MRFATLVLVLAALTPGCVYCPEPAELADVDNDSDSDVDSDTDTEPVEVDTDTEAPEEVTCEFPVETLSGVEIFPTRIYVNAWFEREDSNSDGSYDLIRSFVQVTADPCGGALLRTVNWTTYSLDQNNVDWDQLLNWGVVTGRDNYDEVQASEDLETMFPFYNFGITETEDIFQPDGTIVPVPNDERRFNLMLEQGLYISPGETYTLEWYVSAGDWISQSAAFGDSLRIEATSISWEVADSAHPRSWDTLSELPDDSQSVVF